MTHDPGPLPRAEEGTPARNRAALDLLTAITAGMPRHLARRLGVSTRAVTYRLERVRRLTGFSPCRSSLLATPAHVLFEGSAHNAHSRAKSAPVSAIGAASARLVLITPPSS